MSASTVAARERSTRSRRRALGARIKALREAEQIDQMTLASRLGVSPGSVCDWEKGNTSPRITRIPAIARALKTDAAPLVNILMGA